jgi:4-amino-4-deoxy-L-arabinose transferase-like glycosyltransferase
MRRSILATQSRIGKFPGIPDRSGFPLGPADAFSPGKCYNFLQSCDSIESVIPTAGSRKSIPWTETMTIAELRSVKAVRFGCQTLPYTIALPRQGVVARTTAHTIPLALVVALVLAYLLPGLIGHDPWKSDEAYTFGNVYYLLQTGDWVVPHVAGEPFMEKPPLFHLVAAILAKLAAPVLPLHDGARLASGLFVAFALIAVGWSARRSWGKGYGRGAVLLMLSCVGLLVHAHMMLTDLALTAGFAIAMAGFVACRIPLRWGGLLLGTGAGMAFLSKGLIGPGVIGATALVLPVAFQEWRNRSYFLQLRLAFLAALPWLTIWPVLVYLRSPELFQIWFWDNNIGRFIGFSVPHLGAAKESGFLWKTFPWFLFPIWLVVALVFWKWRRDAWRQPAVQIGITLSAIFCLVLWASASARAIYLLPMVATLALVGAGAFQEIPSRIERAFAFMGIALGSVAIVFFWLVWASMVTGGHAASWRWLGRWLPLEFVLPVSASTVAAATLLTSGAILFVVMTWKNKPRGLAVWCASVTITWGLIATLWLPWLDAAKSYREMFQTMAFALPSEVNCVARRNLGESERALLDYVLGIKTQREEVSPGIQCNVLLVQSTAERIPSVTDDMELAWSGNRQNDSHERFFLYVSSTWDLILAMR